MGRLGFEPRTIRLKGEYSTAELPAHGGTRLLYPVMPAKVNRAEAVHAFPPCVIIKIMSISDRGRRVSETEWQTLMQAARSLGISRARAYRYAAYIADEDRQVLEAPNGTQTLQVRLSALQHVYQAQRYRHGERRDGQPPARSVSREQDPEKTAASEQIALYQELLSERQMRLAEWEQRIQNQAAQIARLESMLSSPSVPLRLSPVHPSSIRPKPLRRSPRAVPDPPQETEAGQPSETAAVELRPLAAIPETSIGDTSRSATTDISVVPSATLEEQLQTSLPQETKLPRKEIGKNGIAAAQWNGLTLVEDESFLEELPEPEPEPEEDQVLEEIDAVSPKKKKQNWLLSLLDES